MGGFPFLFGNIIFQRVFFDEATYISKTIDVAKMKIVSTVSALILQGERKIVNNQFSYKCIFYIHIAGLNRTSYLLRGVF